ncbi:MAG: ATP-binding protein, partial [Candidatus Magasanikbacteria bacterium]|nr:ATP-binding protein [Candidatus Magasanikbacteria bacterium]
LKAFRAGIQSEHAVIGCTSWGLYKALDEGWHGGSGGTRVAEIFDLVCIDEASQLLVPQALMCLAGLREGGRVLIAGDNKQLAPIGGGHDWSVDNRSLGGSVYDFLVEAKIPEQRLNETFFRVETVIFLAMKNYTRMCLL